MSLPVQPMSSQSSAVLSDRYAQVRERIASAAKRSGRTAASVILVAVSKTAEPEQIRELIRLGQIDFAENRVPQLMQRAALIDEWLGRQRTMPGVQRASGTPAVEDDLWSAISGSSSPAPTRSPAQSASSSRSAGASQLGAGSPKVRWHMIGHLQRNKARKAVELCRLIHSVDSLRLAEELQLIAFKRDQPVEVLLQVNCSGEPQKYGCAPAAALHLAEQIETMVHVRLRGLMTMAAHTENAEASRETFARCRELFLEVRDSGLAGPNFDVLSMGMSGDYEIAIQEGSNLVRVGSALFGDPKPGSEETGDDDND